MKAPQPRWRLVGIQRDCGGSSRCAGRTGASTMRQPGRSGTCCGTVTCSWLVTWPARFRKSLPTGSWHDPPSQVALLPIVSAGGDRQARHSDRRLEARFGCSTAATWISSDSSRDRFAGAVANADAYEQERLRAEVAGQARQRQDGFLLQRQPRVPHAADVDAGAARRVARGGRTCCRRASASGSRSCIATACGC